MQVAQKNPEYGMVYVIVVFIINLECVFLSLLMNNRILGGGYAATNLSLLFEVQSYVSFLLFLWFFFKKDKEKCKLFTLLNCLSATGTVAGIAMLFFFGIRV